MKRIWIIALCMGCTIQSLIAQGIEIKGTVCNTTNQPIEFANIVLQTEDSTFVNGVTSNENGEFALKNIDKGNYLLTLSSIGYQSNSITLNGIKDNVNLGRIVLDTIAIALEGVTVTASAQVSQADRKLVFPSERQIKVATNGLNLLQEMMLPRILINTIDNTISLSGGGELQLRINGAKAELEEVKALRPEDIVRIEYHDNPGLRYGNAEVVLDYIVRRPETGGSFGTDLTQGVNAMWGEYNLYGKINHKKSEFGFSYRMGPRDFYGTYRDNEEEFYLADGTYLHRIEKGEPDRLSLLTQNASLNYSLQPSEKSMFSAAFRMFSNRMPHQDYQGILYNADDPTDQVEMQDKSNNNNLIPSLDLYYQHELKNKQTLVVNVVGTYIREKTQRLYQESKDGELLTDIDNYVLGKRYSLIGEVMYEKRFDNGQALSFGINHNQSYSNNEYRNGHLYNTDMNQSNSYLFGEFKGKIKKLDYRVGLAVTRYTYSQNGSEESTKNYSFNPNLMLHYAFSEHAFLRWKGNVYNMAPSLGNLSAVEQEVDSFQIRRGNPNLKSYLCYHTELTGEWQKGIFYTNLWTAYDYQPKAIMDEKFQEGDKIVQTWDNQKDWQKVSGRAMFRIGPIRDLLQLSFTGGVNHYMSHGNHYSHTYTNWFCEAQASLTYKRFSLSWQMNTNWNNFWGETLTGGENIQILGLYYRHKDLRVGIGAFNPFTNDYKVQNENWNQFASYKTKNYIKESSRLFLLSFSYNFSFGRSFKSTQRKVNNSDNASGVMSTGK